MPSFSHSGTTGDTFSSLVAVKLLGGGDYYLRLHNLDKMIQEKLGWPNAGLHSGRMSQHDFDIMRELMLHQPYINSFNVYTNEHIDYELENAAKYLYPGVTPRNFPNQHALANNIDLQVHFKQLQIEPYMECREPRKISSKPICVFRNTHHRQGNDILSNSYKSWLERGLLEQAFFIGLSEDHDWFENTLKVKIQHVPTPDFMEMARLIQGSELLICNQSSPCALGLALGKTMWIETRKDVALEQNECFYPYRININYF